ncbi:MAG: PepSY domain-containing protein [Steroidobacteraceae bacterium]
MTRWLILCHRWFGIPLSLMVMVWFVSGIAMIYAGGMPRLTPQARLDHLPALDVAQVKLTPAQATVPIGGEDALPGAPVLVMIQGRPAYRFAFADNATVYADDGSLLIPLDEAAAKRVAQQFLRVPTPDLAFVGTVSRPDQWTLTARGVFPLLKFDAHDARGTQLYVSTVTGEVTQATTRRERALAWISTIPHWLYFSGLRQNQPVWYPIVVWLSVGVCVLAVLGLMLAYVQWRRARRVPHRGGMRWHFIAGSIFGVFVITWSFSGLVSMEPWDWTDVAEVRLDPTALTGGEPELAAYDAVNIGALAALVEPRFIKAITFQRIHGDHYLTLQTSAHADALTLPLERLHAPYDVGGRAQDSHVLVSAATTVRHDQPFDGDAIVARIRAALPGVGVTAQELLLDYDDYYYSRSRQTPLPVLRVKLDDELQTWLYVDPMTSQVVANVHRYSRIERWLYSGLHSLDFRFWYAKRPLWDLVMLTLLAGGLVASALGFWYGVRRLLRA